LELLLWGDWSGLSPAYLHIPWFTFPLANAALTRLSENLRTEVLVASQTFVFRRHPFALLDGSVPNPFLSFSKTFITLITFTGLQQNIFVVLFAMLLIVMVLAIFLEVMLAWVSIVGEGCDIGRVFGETMREESLD
jgi:hypothetical protein